LETTQDQDICDHCHIGKQKQQFECWTTDKEPKAMSNPCCRCECLGQCRPKERAAGWHCCGTENGGSGCWTMSGTGHCCS
jgi:hypothetical protein